MLQTRCLNCGIEFTFNQFEGMGYFFGFDTEYYGDSYDEIKDPHEILGYYCKVCGDKLRIKSDVIGYKRID